MTSIDNIIKKTKLKSKHDILKEFTNPKPIQNQHTEEIPLQQSLIEEKQNHQIINNTCDQIINENDKISFHTETQLFIITNGGITHKFSILHILKYISSVIDKGDLNLFIPDNDLLYQDAIR